MYVQGLGTAIWSLSYDACTRIGTIEMPEGCCTDMTGAVKLFTQIDPAVIRVITRAGGKVDTTYERQGSKWAVISNRPPHGLAIEDATMQ